MQKGMIVHIVFKNVRSLLNVKNVLKLNFKPNFLPDVGIIIWFNLEVTQCVWAIPSPASFRNVLVYYIQNKTLRNDLILGIQAE
jgi:hypothetical protein